MTLLHVVAAPAGINTKSLTCGLESELATEMAFDTVTVESASAVTVRPAVAQFVEYSFQRDCVAALHGACP